MSGGDVVGKLEVYPLGASIDVDFGSKRGSTHGRSYGIGGGNLEGSPLVESLGADL